MFIMLTPEKIRSIELQKVGFGGYKVNDVDVFLEEVATDFELMTKQKNELIQKLQILAENIEDYRNTEETVKLAILNAQKTGDMILKESNEKSQLILDECNSKAEEIEKVSKEKTEKMLDEAKFKARQLLDDATMKANNIINEAENKAKNIARDIDINYNKQLLTYNYIKDEIKKFKSSTINSYKEHLDLINNINDININIEKYELKEQTVNHDKGENN